MKIRTSIIVEISLPLHEKTNIMPIKAILPRHGDGTLRIDDSDDLVVMENFGTMPKGDVMLEKHALIVLCTEGMAQFDYEGQQIQLRKGDLFLYFMLRSVVSNFMSSPDFNCRQIWFVRSEAWNVDTHGITSISDVLFLKRQPKVTLTDADAAMLDSYFQLLTAQMRDRKAIHYEDLVRTLSGALILKVLSLMRGAKSLIPDDTGSVHGKQLVDRFMQLVERSDGRIRRVDEFASMLNVTPKYLSGLLKETLNRGPSEVISLLTMKAIERRLRFTDMTMQQIANDLNFANPSFFGKYFKEHAGITPLEYRRKYQEQ